MKIGIIFAMESEFQAYQQITEKVKCNHQIFTYVSGIGKVNASVTTTKAILEDKLDLVINCGVAGGLNNVKRYDVIYATELNYSDVDLSIFSHLEVGQVPRMPKVYYSLNNTYNFSKAREGKIVSQDSFALSHQYDHFKENFSDYQAVDMESTSIAQTAYKLNVDVVVIRSISDLVFEEDNHLEFEVAEKIAADNAAESLVELLNQI